MSSTSTDSVAAADERLAEQGVRNLLVTMTDQAGILRARIVPVARAGSAIARGLSFSLTSALMLCSDDHIATVPGFEQAIGDVRLFPDLDAMRMIDESSGLGWIPAHQRTLEGQPFAVCQRQALDDQVEAGRTLGLDFRMAFEIELTVFRSGPEGLTLAHDGPGYGLAPLLVLEPWLEEVLETCARAGVELEQVHAEYGAGQVELALPAKPPSECVDDVTVTRIILARTALRHGLAVSFAPVAVVGGAGNGSHVHLSALQGDSNVFADGESGQAMSPAGQHLIGGLLAGLPSAVAFLAPSVNSYERLQPGHFSGAYSCWGTENREAAVRYIPGAPGRRRASANCEIKTVDGSANPSLAAAAILAMALDGFRSATPLPPETAQVPSPTPEQPGGPVRLATDLPTALTLLHGAQTLRRALGDALIDTYIAVRAHEHDAWAALPLPERVAGLRFRY